MASEAEIQRLLIFTSDRSEFKPDFTKTRIAAINKIREGNFRLLRVKGVLTPINNDTEESEEFSSEFSELFNSKNDLKLIFYKMIRLIEEHKGEIQMQQVRHALNKLTNRFFNETFIKRNSKLFLQIMQMLAHGMNDIESEQSNWNISSSLYKLSQYPNFIVPKELLTAFVKVIQLSDHPFSPDDIGMSIYGLKNLDNQTVPKELLEVLTSKIEGCKEEFTEFAIGNSLYGLKNLDINIVPREFLEAISKKISESDAKLNTFSVSMSFFGLQNLDGSVVPIELIEGLTKKIQESKFDFTGQVLSNILYGIKNLNSSTIPPDFFETLTHKIKGSDPHLNGQDIGNALYGLQNLDESVVPDDFFTEIERKLDESKDELNGQNIGNALYGLLNFSSRSALSLRSKLFALIESIDLTIIDIKYFIQVFNLYGKNPPIRIVRLYTELLKGQKPRSTDREMEAFKWLKKAHPNEIIHRGHFVDGFELDIYFPRQKLNIELDGCHHIKQKERDKRRDKYLMEKRGIKTIRIDLINQDMVKMLEWIDPESRGNELGRNMDAINCSEDVYI